MADDTTYYGETMEYRVLYPPGGEEANERLLFNQDVMPF